MRHKLVVAEFVTTCVSGVVAIITIAWPNWIELVFRADPDSGSRALEILIAGLLVAIAVASAVAVRAQIRHTDGVAKLDDAP